MVKAQGVPQGGLLGLRHTLGVGLIVRGMKPLGGVPTTDKRSLQVLYRNEYKERLTPKPPIQEYQEIQKLKEDLFSKRYFLASKNITVNWTSDQILNVCRKLENKKARDQNGMIYELFKPSYAGDDVYKSLTTMFNAMKNDFYVPDFLQIMSITSFFKNKGDKSSLSCQRGVFNLAKVRSILDKVLYTDKYDGSKDIERDRLS